MPKLLPFKKEKETSPKKDRLEALVFKERLRYVKQMQSADGDSAVSGSSRNKRQKSHKVGEIFVDSNKTISCLVADFSDTGMRLEPAEDGDIPEVFRLRVPTLEFDRDVRVVWRNETAIGVTIA